MMGREKHDPNSQGYTNAILGEMDDKIQTILEATSSIPQIQANVAGLDRRIGKIEQTLDAWKDQVKMIPTIFEEVGSLRVNVEAVKEDVGRLGRRDERLEGIEKRLAMVEERIE